MSKYYIRNTEFEFNKLADARNTAEELAKDSADDIVICVSDTDGVKDIIKGKLVADDRLEEAIDTTKSIETVSPKFVIELTDRQTLVKSFLAEGVSSTKATFNSFAEADKAAKEFMQLGNNFSFFNYCIRVESQI